MKYKIIYYENKIQIISQNSVIYENEISLQNILGDFAYTQLIYEKSEKIPKIIFKEFNIDYIQENINKIRLLENSDSDNENNALSYVEIDKKCLQSNASYLREGNVKLIPSIILNPKDKNGNAILNIRNKTIYPNNFLESIVEINHSKNASFNKFISINKDNQIIILLFLETKIAGEFYISSKYFKNINFEKYIIKVNSYHLNWEQTTAEIFEKEENVAGSSFKLQIIPRDEYGNQLEKIEESEFEKFNVEIKLPNNESILADKEEFNLDKKVLIFKKEINISGISSFSVKYNNNDIICNKCNVKVVPNDIYFDYITINYIYNNNKFQIKENEVQEIYKMSTPFFEIIFFDEYGNEVQNISNYEIESEFTGLNSDIKICNENQNSIKKLFLCQETGNKNQKNWFYLINGEYNLEIRSSQKSKNYKLRLVGNFSDEDASNEKVELNNTYFSTYRFNEIIAGEFKELEMELRASDGKRVNYWYDEPSNEIQIEFKKNSSCNSKVSTAGKPGQYFIQFTCTKSVNENQLILIIEGIKFETNVTFNVIPEEFNRIKLLDINDINNQIYKLPEGNADDPYIIKLQVLDNFYNPIDNLNDSDFMIQNDTNNIISEIKYDSNKIITLNYTLKISKEYTLLIPFLKLNYKFTINHGKFDFPSLEVDRNEIETGEIFNLSITAKDKYQNIIPKKEISDKFNVTYTITYENSENENIIYKMLLSENEDNKKLDYSSIKSFYILYFHFQNFHG